MKCAALHASKTTKRSKAFTLVRPEQVIHPRPQWLLLCAVVFAAAVWGSIYCGVELLDDANSPQREHELRWLIYFHFILSQLCIAGAALIIYLRHLARRRHKAQHLVVSYSDVGIGIAPPGIDLPARRTYFSSLHQLASLKGSSLPKAHRPILVYPMMMQSGYSSGERLESLLSQLYPDGQPQFVMQPVLGASPFLPCLVADHLRPQIGQGSGLNGVLVVAHAAPQGQESAPEPELFCRRLRKALPGLEIKLAHFGSEESIHERMQSMEATRVHLLPFLLCEGYHSRNDLPSADDAGACGKVLLRHPVIGDLLREGA